MGADSCSAAAKLGNSAAARGAPARWSASPGGTGEDHAQRRVKRVGTESRASQCTQTELVEAIDGRQVEDQRWVVRVQHRENDSVLGRLRSPSSAGRSR